MRFTDGKNQRKLMAVNMAADILLIKIWNMLPQNDAYRAVLEKHFKAIGIELDETLLKLVENLI